MRIGIQQTAFGEISVAKCFVRARRAGADGLGLCYRTADDACVLGDPRHVARLRALADRFGIGITGLHLGILCTAPCLIGDAFLIARSQEVVRRAIAMAAELGGPDVIVPFFGRNRIEFPRELDAAVSALQELSEAAEDAEVVLAVESSLHVGQLQQLLSACASDCVKACLDTGDSTACRYDAASMIRSLRAEDIAQVHLKDVRAVSGLPPDFNVRLGRGDVRFHEVASALRSVGYGGWLLVETPPGDDRGAIAAANVQYARDLFRTLRPTAVAAGEEPVRGRVPEGVAQ